MVYSYDRLDLPEGVILRDASEVVPRSLLFYFDNPKTWKPDLAPFADYFRLKLLVEKGGWYCDVDTVCLSAELPVGSRVWARECPELDIDSVSNGQLYFEAGDRVVMTLLRRCELLLPRLQRRESLGPMLFTSVLKELGLPGDMNATTREFYPLRWIEAFKLWLPEFAEEVEERLSGAIFLPVFHSFLLYLGLDPNKQPPKGSYLAALLEKFAPELEGPSHSATDIRDATKRWFNSNGAWAVRWLTSIRGPEVLRQLSL